MANKEPKNESEVEQLIKIDGVQFGCFLMRNNSGALKDLTGRPVRYGLGNDSKARNEKIKSSDEIGFTRVLITPEMVGKTIAVVTAIEIKAPGWKPKIKIDGESFEVSYKDPRERAQYAFIKWIKANGGFAGFASSIEEFRKIIGR